MYYTNICPNCLNKVILQKGISKPMHCNICGTLMFRCDNGIVDQVIALNTLGYRTYMCCEGHHIKIDARKHSSYPFILFSPKGIINPNDRLFQEIFVLCQNEANSFNLLSRTTLKISNSTAAGYIIDDNGKKIPGSCIALGIDNLCDANVMNDSVYDFLRIRGDFFLCLNYLISVLPNLN